MMGATSMQELASCARMGQHAEYALCRQGAPRRNQLVSSMWMVCCRFTDLLLLEVDAEVQEFVSCLKDWPLKW